MAGNSNSNSNSSSDSKNLNLQPEIFDISQIFRLIHVKLFRLERHARVVMSRNGLVTVIIEDNCHNWSTTFSRQLFKSRAIKMYRNKATSLVFGKCNPFATHNLLFKKIIYHRILTQTLFLATRRDGFHLLRNFLLYRDGSVDTYCEHGGHVLS